ncbi:MAG: NAD(P)/FAD-dependent oxidoreductase [Patescibacteria group bacterium]
MYDLVIIGAGSAGLPAAMYASRYALRNLVIGEMPGGALATSHRVENWPGTQAEGGKSIMDRFAEHATASGSEILTDRVVSVEGAKGAFTVTTTSGKSVETKYVLLATGNKYRHLGAPGEAELLGSGVSYCATCDGNFFKGREVVVVGGGDSAAVESLYLAEICSKVTILVRKDAFKAEDVWVKKIAEHANMEVRFNSEVAEIRGDFMGVKDVLLKDGTAIPCEGFFVAIGSDPDASLITPLGVATDEEGCVIVDKTQATNVPGIYAAGDVTTNSNKFKQTIMSAAEGCLAAHSIHEEIMRS